MKIYKEVEQRSDLWYSLRRQRITASNASVVATNGKGLETYIYTLMSEYYSSAEKEHYTNSDIERGVLLEPEAKIEFQFYTGLTLEEVGFVEMNDFVGCSPDALVGDDGLAEFKAPNDLNYFKLLMTGDIKPEYLWQVQFQMLVCERKYCYFVSYNPNFEKTLFIKKIDRDEEMIAKIQAGLDYGTKLIKEIKCKYEKLKGEKNGKI